MLLFVYTTTRKRFVIFTCRYFKLSWNTTTLSQSSCRNFSCSGIKEVISTLHVTTVSAGYCKTRRTSKSEQAREKRVWIVTGAFRLLMTGRAFGAGFVQPVRNQSQATVKSLSILNRRPRTLVVQHTYWLWKRRRKVSRRSTMLISRRGKRRVDIGQLTRFTKITTSKG